MIHYTLNMGHSRISPRDEVMNSVVDAQRRAEARASGQPLEAEVSALSPRLHDAVSEALAIGMTTFDGDPGSGKTAGAIQIATTARVPALIVECKVRPVRIVDRMIACHTGTFFGKLKDGSLSPETIRDLAQRALDGMPELVPKVYVPLSNVRGSVVAA